MTPPRPDAQPSSPAAAAGPHLWGVAEIKARLAEAAQTLRALGLGVRDRPARLAARWPDVVQASFEAYGYATLRQRPPAPSPGAISRADETVGWLLWLGAAERRILWGRASRIPWRRLEDMDGRSHTTLRRVEAEALAVICRQLNQALAPAEAVCAAFRQGRDRRREEN